MAVIDFGGVAEEVITRDEFPMEKALQVLAGDPMIRDFHEAEKVLDALVEAQGDRLKRFRKRNRIS